MEAMNLKICPRSPFMKLIVDYYQLVKIPEPMMLRTLPNGRLDAWINFSGNFCMMDERTGEFIIAPETGFFPLTDRSMLIKISEPIVCLNIKFFPIVLLYGNLNKLLNTKQLVSFTKVFEAELDKAILGILPDEENIDSIIRVVEEFFINQLSAKDQEETCLFPILQRIENDTFNAASVRCLAREFNLTEKTLERTFIR